MLFGETSCTYQPQRRFLLHSFVMFEALLANPSRLLPAQGRFPRPGYFWTGARGVVTGGTTFGDQRAARAAFSSGCALEEATSRAGQIRNELFIENKVCISAKGLQTIARTTGVSNVPKSIRNTSSHWTDSTSSGSSIAQTGTAPPTNRRTLLEDKQHSHRGKSHNIKEVF